MSSERRGDQQGRGAACTTPSCSFAQRGGSAVIGRRQIRAASGITDHRLCPALARQFYVGRSRGGAPTAKERTCYQVAHSRNSPWPASTRPPPARRNGGDNMGDKSTLRDGVRRLFQNSHSPLGPGVLEARSNGRGVASPPTKCSMQGAGTTGPMPPALDGKQASFLEC